MLSLMSALSHKWTCAPQKVMSPLPPKSEPSELTLECPLCAKSGHDRPHSSTLATKHKKRIRQRPPIVIVPLIVAAPRRIVPIAPGNKEAVVARKVAIVGRLARYKPALRLVTQHRDKFGAIVGLATQRFVRDDDRGARQGGLRDSIEHILRDGDAVERILGFIPVVDRDCGPAQARVVTRHRGEHMRAYRFVGIVDRDRDLDA